MDYESIFFVSKKFRKTYPSVAMPIKEPDDVPFNRRAGYDYMGWGNSREIPYKKIDECYLETISNNTPTESEVIDDDIFEYVAGKEKRI